MFDCADGLGYRSTGSRTAALQEGGMTVDLNQVNLSEYIKVDNMLYDNTFQEALLHL